MSISSPARAFDWFKAGKDLLQKTSEEPTSAVAALTNTEIATGLKEALKVGSERVVSQLGMLDGFNTDPEIHIPLPPNVNKIRSILGNIGQQRLLEDLELKLNRAAEAATPQAKDLLAEAIREMTLDDVQKIYKGPADAATQYFKEKMSQPLASAMHPIVDSSMAEVGAVQAWDAVMGRYQSIPFVPDIKTNLTTWVVEKGMDGIFFYLAKEEAAIRQNPVKRTTEVLQKVFGPK